MHDAYSQPVFTEEEKIAVMFLAIGFTIVMCTSILFTTIIIVRLRYCHCQTRTFDCSTELVPLTLQLLEQGDPSNRYVRSRSKPEDYYD